MFYNHILSKREKCETCPEGRPRLNGYYCELCPAGYEPSTSGSFGCTPCPKDSFKKKKGNHKCKRCERGSHTISEAPTACHKIIYED